MLKMSENAARFGKNLNSKQWVSGLSGKIYVLISKDVACQAKQLGQGYNVSSVSCYQGNWNCNGFLCDGEQTLRRNWVRKFLWSFRFFFFSFWEKMFFVRIGRTLIRKMVNYTNFFFQWASESWIHCLYIYL